MTQPATEHILGHQETGWWYIEFTGSQTATPGAPPGTTVKTTDPGESPSAIANAQTWLNKNITPGTNPVFGMVDGQGTVRMFWYGTVDLPIVIDPPVAAE
jgi:hypothetical protein